MNWRAVIAEALGDEVEFHQHPEAYPGRHKHFYDYDIKHRGATIGQASMEKHDVEGVPHLTPHFDVDEEHQGHGVATKFVELTHKRAAAEGRRIGVSALLSHDGQRFYDNLHAHQGRS